MRNSSIKAPVSHEEKASLLETAARLRRIGRTRGFGEDEADAAVAVQRLLDGEEPIPAAGILKQIEHDLGRRGEALRREGDRRSAKRRKA
jgi:hypothetical protein